MTDPLVSVIMPSYNADRFIAESIQSVIDQTYTHWELLVIDDGSTDKTAGVVKQFLENEPRITYVYQPNGKQGKARNNGIGNSKGQFLAFLDADDLWVKEKLQIQVKLFKQRPDVDLIFSQGYTLTSDSNLATLNFKIREWTWEKDGDELIDCNQVPILSVMIKKAVVLNVGGFSENPAVQNAEDYHLWIKILKSGARFLSIADRLFYYRVHPDQSTYLQRGMHMAIINSYVDLIKNGVIDRDNKALKFRVKWMILNDIDLDGLYGKLKTFFPQRKLALLFYITFNKLFPRNVLNQRLAYRLL